MRIDFVALEMSWAEMAAMVDRGRKCRAREIAGNGKPEVLHQPKETVAMIVGVDRGKIVGSRIEVEIGSHRFGRWQHRGRSLHIGKRHVGSAQGLSADHGRGESCERD